MAAFFVLMALHAPHHVTVPPGGKAAARCAVRSARVEGLRGRMTPGDDDYAGVWGPLRACPFWRVVLSWDRRHFYGLRLRRAAEVRYVC